MPKRLIFGAALACALASPALASCTLAHGGEVNDCWRLTDNPISAEIGRVFSSGGTMALRNARCVRADSIWRFHAAHELNGTIREDGNDMLRASYPLGVRAHLDRIGALNTVRFTTLSGRDLGRLGVPLCRR